MYLWSMRSPGGGKLSLSACPGVGNRPPSKKKIANPRGCARGGMVTGSQLNPALDRYTFYLRSQDLPTLPPNSNETG